MQDEATPYRTQKVLQAIHYVYEIREIGLGYWNGHLIRPTGTLATISSGVALRRNANAENPITTELMKAIKKVIYGITTDMLEKVFYSFRKRIDFYAELNSSHYENICH